LPGGHGARFPGAMLVQQFDFFNQLFEKSAVVTTP
jgi:hypothetical protein